MITNGNNRQQLLIPELERLIALPLDSSQQWRNYLHRFFTKTPIDDAEHPEPSHEMSGCYWCHGVKFHPDHAGVRVVHATGLVADKYNRQTVLSILNAHFNDSAFEFFEHDDKLLVRSERLLPDCWPDIFSMVNRNLYELLEQSEQGLSWISLINECQMLFSSIDHTDIELSDSINGIWVSHIPNWLFSEDARNTQSLVEGAEYLLQQAYAEIDVWLSDWLKQLQTQPAMFDVVLSDGQSRWQMKRMQRLKRKLLG